MFATPLPTPEQLATPLPTPEQLESELDGCLGPAEKLAALGAWVARGGEFDDEAEVRRLLRALRFCLAKTKCDALRALVPAMTRALDQEAFCSIADERLRVGVLGLFESV